MKNGNTSVCSFTVTVEDNENLIAVTQDITVTLDGSGAAVIAPGDIDAGSTDNFGIDSMSLNIDTFTVDDVGEYNVTLTVTDLSGNTHTATATVTVVDDEAPVIVCASPAPVITVIEDFDSGLPAGWSAVTNSGPCDWEVGELPWAGYGFGSNGIIFDDDACGLAAAPSNVTLTSDSYDTTGALALELKYDVAYRQLGSSSFTVEVFDGTDWKNVATYTTNTETITESFDLLMYSNSDFQV